MVIYTVLLYVHTLYEYTKVMPMKNSMTNVVQFPVSCTNQTACGQKGWSYLIAESVAFNKEVDFGIRIQKPRQEKVPQWISRIIKSGQCNSIYVENLQLEEAEKHVIENLCHQHDVSLFSLSVVQEKKRKVVHGPW